MTVAELVGPIRVVEAAVVTPGGCTTGVTKKTLYEGAGSKEHLVVMLLHEAALVMAGMRVVEDAFTRARDRALSLLPSRLG